MLQTCLYLNLCFSVFLLTFLEIFIRSAYVDIKKALSTYFYNISQKSFNNLHSWQQQLRNLIL